MSGRHRKQTNTGRAVAKVAVTSAIVGGAGVALAGHASAAPESDWDKLAQCESGGNWGINTGNGFQGGLQFSPGTWASHGGTDYAASANQASREQQIFVAEKVLATQGWGAWPACSQHLGLSSSATPRESPNIVTPNYPSLQYQDQDGDEDGLAPEVAPDQQRPLTESQQVYQDVDKMVTGAESEAQTHGFQVPQQALDAYNAFKANNTNLDPSVVNFFEANQNVVNQVAQMNLMPH